MPRAITLPYETHPDKNRSPLKVFSPFVPTAKPGLTAKDAKGAKEEGVDKNFLRILRVLRGLI
jgi:hypothetical protein